MSPKKTAKASHSQRTIRRHTRLAQLQERILLEAAARPDVQTLHQRLMSVVMAAGPGWFGQLAKRQQEALIYYVRGVFGAVVLLQQELGAIPQRVPELSKLDVRKLLLPTTAQDAPRVRQSAMPAPALAPNLPVASASSSGVVPAPVSGNSGGSMLRALLLEAARIDAEAGIPYPEGLTDGAARG